MSESLRRSSRRTRKVGFKVGDVVEITKSGIIVKGRLINQIESNQSNQPRWRITYDDDAFVDEELSESSLGHILTGNSDTESPTQPPAPNSAPSPIPSPASVAAATAARKKNRKNGRFVKTNGEEQLFSAETTTDTATVTDSAVLDKKTAVNSHEASDSSAANSRQRASAREQRTARRNRSLPDHKQQKQKLPPAPVAKKRPPVPTGGGGGKSSKKAKGGVDEEVVKVPMLTGTLYLYKGIRRRAEFVRKY